MNDRTAVPDTPPPSDADPAAWTKARGDSLAKTRRSRGILQADLAASLGVPRSVLSNWENATRRPNPDQVDRLAATLGVETTNFDAIDPAVDQPPATVRDQLREAAAEYVAADQHHLLDRFLTQVSTFERLSPGEDLPLKRWRSARRLAEDSVDELIALDGQNARTRRLSANIGRGVGLALRRQLDLADAPLPTVEAIAEICGVHIFRAPFTPNGQARLRGLLLESDQLGAVALINSFVAESSQRIVLTEVIAKVLLQPPGGFAVHADGAQPSRTNLDRAVVAFVHEFALPHSALHLEVVTAFRDQLAGPHTDPAEIDEGTATQFVEKVVEKALVYAVPAGYVLSYGPNVHPEYLRRVARAVNLARARTSQARRRTPAHPSWRLIPDDIPQRFLHRLLQSVINGRGTLAGVARLTGLADADLELLLMTATTGITADDLPSGDDSELDWVDHWRAVVA